MSPRRGPLAPEEKWTRRMKAIRTEAIKLDREYHIFSEVFPDMKATMDHAHGMIKEVLKQYGVPCATDADARQHFRRPRDG